MSERQPIDLSELLAESMKLLGRTIPEQVRLVLDLPSGTESHHVLADPAQLQQAITNLVLNAQDAMPRGGEVRLTLESLRIRPADKPPFPGMQPGSWLSISVADTGTGITETLRSRVFEPFFTTKEPGHGTGLGLAQVYGIVKKNEGFIDFSTRENQGTTFQLYFPRITDSLRDRAATAISMPRGEGQLLVVVEDQRQLLRIVSHALSVFGYEVVSTDDPREATGLLERLDRGSLSSSRTASCPRWAVPICCCVPVSSARKPDSC